MVRRRGDELSLAETFDGLRADYAGAKASRFRRRRNVPVSGAGADYHYRNEADYLRLLEYARDMDRNDCVVGATIDRAVTNLIQEGISLDVRTGDKGLDRELAARWTDWGDDPDQCDVAGELTWSDYEYLGPRHMLADGDVFCLRLDEGSLQSVESHRCRTPRSTIRNVVHGVLLDDRRRRLQYWFTRDDVDPWRSIEKVSQIQAYDARDDEGNRLVGHLYHRKRFSQTRGVTALAPIFDVLGMFEDIQFAKLVQQQVVSCFAFFRKRSAEWQALNEGRPGGQEATGREIEGYRPGMQIKTDPGEEIEGWSPNVPNPEFFDHVRLILTLVGINLGLPLVMVLLDAKETNFSGWRGAVDQARLGFRTNQQEIIRRWHRPTYLWKVRQWLDADPAMQTTAAKSGVNVFGHRWNPPRWPYIEPLKDASAALLRVRNALTSQRRRAAEDGADWEDLATEIVDDNALAIEKAWQKADELNKRYPGLGVHWRELISLPTPDGVTITVGGQEETVKENPRDKQPAG